MDTKRDVVDETQALRRCVRELVALSTLSAVWRGNDDRQIAQGLCRVLCSSLPAELVFARINGADGTATVEITGSQRAILSSNTAREIVETLEGLLRPGRTEPIPTIENPFGSGRLRFAVVPIGHEADCGIVAAGSTRSEFPTQTDRLLLSIGANQAATVLQQERSEAQVRRSERELADFFDNASLGLHWVGPDGTILRANHAELALLGYSHDEYIGHNIAEFHADSDSIRDILRRLSAAETIRDYPARMRCKDGSIKHVLIDSSVLWDRGAFVHSRCFTRDVTEQRLAEESFRKQSARLQLLLEAAGEMLAADNPDAMLRGLFAKVGEHLGVDAFFNFAVDDNGDALELVSCEGISYETARTIARLDFGQAICGSVAASRRPLVAACIQQSDDPKVQLAKSFGLRAYACNPLLVGDRLLGTLSFASRTKDRFEPDEAAFMQTICHYVTVAYERLRLLKELKEADRRKDEFLATLAHELRNPLAPVRSAVQLLRLKGPDEPELRWGRDVIDRQVEHLTRLIDDLMDISRITRNRLELRTQRVELADVIRGAVEASRPSIEQYGHELEVTLPLQPIYLNADLVRLAQVFLNLLNNAAKYTERGGRIWLTAEPLAGHVMVRVRDNGMGIPPEKIGSLFEMFYQVDRTLERSKGGLGIGLSLVRRLVEMHGGKVEGRSEGIGRGSEFIVRLPVLSGTPESLAGASPEDKPGQRTTAHRILVVDDNRDSADSLAMLLRMTGHEVQTAYDGCEGMEAAQRYKPDAVLLDIGMPKMNGYDVCRRIRNEAWGKKSILIAMTGWGQEEDRRSTVQAGFDGHMVKPVDSGALLNLLSKLSAREALVAKESQLAASSTGSNPAHRSEGP